MECYIIYKMKGIYYIYFLLLDARSQDISQHGLELTHLVA